MPVTLPTAQDVRRARSQATSAVTSALEQARTPLYAALGAGELATEKVVSAARRARSEATGQTDTVQTRLAELQALLAELPVRARTRLNELPAELNELRGKLEPHELRELVDVYRRSLQELYGRLAVRGEHVYGKLATEPRVKKAVGRIEHAAGAAEVRVEQFVGEARTVADDVLGRVSRRTRSTGEKAANTVQRTAADTAGAVDRTGEAVERAGDEAASTTRSVTRKAANRTQPAKPTSRKTNSASRKT